MFDVSHRFLHQLAADRRASLQRSGEHRTAGPLRHAVGSRLVRLGLRPSHDVNVPPTGTQLGPDTGHTTVERSPSVATSPTGEDYP
jgi:hypothetical protein